MLHKPEIMNRIERPNRLGIQNIIVVKPNSNAVRWKYILANPIIRINVFPSYCYIRLGPRDDIIHIIHVDSKMSQYLIRCWFVSFFFLVVHHSGIQYMPITYSTHGGGFHKTYSFCRRKIERNTYGERCKVSEKEGESLCIFTVHGIVKKNRSPRFPIFGLLYIYSIYAWDSGNIMISYQ